MEDVGVSCPSLKDKRKMSQEEALKFIHTTVMETAKLQKEVVKSHQIKMESEKKKKLTLVPRGSYHVEVDPICGIESACVRMILKDECYSAPVHFNIRSNTLQMVLCYCEQRAKIKLRHHLQLQLLKKFVSKFLQYDDEDLTAQHEKQLNKFDSRFLQAVRMYGDYHLPLDIFDAAVKLHIKSLYDLVLGDVVDICDKLTSEEILKTFTLDDDFHICNFSRFSWANFSRYGWAFTLNRNRNVDK